MGKILILLINCKVDFALWAKIRAGHVPSVCFAPYILLLGAFKKTLKENLGDLQ